MHDYTGLDAESFTVTADFEIDGIVAGENLASRFKPQGEGVWELQLERPIAALPQGEIQVSIKDREGKVARVQRAFAVGPAESSDVDSAP